MSLKEEMTFNDARTVLRDFIINFDIERIQKAIELILEKSPPDPPLPDWEELCGIFADPPTPYQIRRPLLLKKFDLLEEEAERKVEDA